VIHAPFVVSNADPKRTLSKLLPKSSASGDVYEKALAHDVRGSMARIHLLIDELPHYNGFGPELGVQHKGHAIINATPALFEHAAQAQRRGEFPDDYVVEALIPSVTDPSLAQ